MAFRYEINGRTVDFDEKPDEADLNEVAESIGNEPEKASLHSILGGQQAAQEPGMSPTEPQGAAPGEQAPQEAQPSFFERAVASPFATGVGAIGEMSRIEEGAIAAPMVEAAKGQQDIGKLVQSSLNAVTQGFSGKKVAEFGDILRENGADEASAALGGLAMSAFITPSSWMTMGATAGAGKMAGKGANITQKVVREIADAYINTPDGAKGALNKALSFTMGKDPRLVQLVMDNVDDITHVNGSPKNSPVIASKMRAAYDYVEKKFPRALYPDEETPAKIAAQAHEQHKAVTDVVLKDWKATKDELIKQNPGYAVPESELLDYLQGLAGKKGVVGAVGGSDDAAAMGTIRRLYKDIQGMATETPASLKGDVAAQVATLRGTPKAPTRSIGLDKLFNLRREVGQRAYGTQSRTGFVRAGTSEAAVLKDFRKFISSRIQKDFPSIAQKDSALVSVLDSADSLKAEGLDTPKQLAAYLKQYAKDPVAANEGANTFKREALDLLDTVLPENAKTIPEIDIYKAALDSSLGKQLESTTGIKRGSINSLKFQQLVDSYDLLDSPEAVKMSLKALDDAAPESMKFLKKLNVYSAASQIYGAGAPGSLFKAGGFGGTVGGAVSNVAPAAKPLGVLAGIGASIPKVVVESARGMKKLHKALEPARALFRLVNGAVRDVSQATGAGAGLRGALGKKGAQQYNEVKKAS